MWEIAVQNLIPGAFLIASKLKIIALEGKVFFG